MEVLAVRWLLPGTEVRIDTHCLDCGESIMPLANWALAFSGSMCRGRLGPDILSRRSEYMAEIWSTLQGLGKEGPFWQPG
jgi:hypothetical protein